MVDNAGEYIAKALNNIKKCRKKEANQIGRQAKKLHKVVKICQLLMKKYPKLAEFSRLHDVHVVEKIVIISGEVYCNDYLNHHEKITRDNLLKIADEDDPLRSFNKINEKEILSQVLMELQLVCEMEKMRL